MDGMTEPEPTKAGHGPSHSTDFNWLWLLPSTGPSQSGVSYIERRSVSNPALTTGSPALYQLSYGTGYGMDGLDLPSLLLNERTSQYIPVSTNVKFYVCMLSRRLGRTV